MIKRILLATDGSLPSKSAEAFALDLAGRLQADLVGLFVKDMRLVRYPEILDFGAVSVPMPTYHEAMDQALEARAQDVLRRVAEGAEKRGVSFEALLRTGVPYEVIVAEAKKADLVVLGRAGEQEGHLATGLGSTVERVARTSAVPVFVAPLGFEPMRRVLVGYDGSDLAARTLHFVADFISALSLSPVVVSVAAELKQASMLAAEGAEYLRSHGVSADAKALSGDPGEELISFQEPSDLLAIGAFGRGRVVEWLLGSTTEYVLRHAVGPVLLVR